MTKKIWKERSLIENDNDIDNENLNKESKPSSPEEHRIDIPEDIMEEIQKNSQRKQSRYLWEAEIGDLIIRFHQNSIRFYMLQELKEWETPIADKEEPGVITENIVSDWKQYKLAFHMNWVWAKQLARLVKGFSITPFNI